MNRGRLLVFEGLDGCGKSTQQPLLVAALRAAGHDVVDTREPTDGPEGRRLRALARAGQRAEPAEELRLFVADRRRHVAGTIEPALAAGRVVVSDRYFPSTVAYQGARGLDWRTILAESEAEFPWPDLVLLLEVEPRLGLERVRARGAALESFEDEAALARVAEVFAALDRPYVARIDGSGEPSAVHVAVRRCVAERLGLLERED